MTQFHLDVWTPDPVASAEFSVKLVDFGADNAYGGGDDSETLVKFTSPDLVSETWIALDIPLTGMTNKANMAQLVLEGNEFLNTVYIDNAYFHKGGGSEPVDEPAAAAPAPAQDAGDVVSVFSDSYTNISGTNFYPGWGQATTVTEVAVQGNNTLLYSGLDFQGIELGSSQDVSGMGFLHVDYWTANSTAMDLYLISTGPVETASALTVPTSGWGSVDIPLGNFSPVDLADVFQLKFVGNGDIYLDNIYFFKSATPESDATLSDLQVDGTTIPGFSPGTLNYSVKLPEGTVAVPTVTVTENNVGASSVITAAGSIPGTTSIVVTAQDGITQKTYTIDFSIQTTGGAWSTSELIDFESGGFGADWTWNIFENDTNPPLEFVSNPDASGANTSTTVAKITALQAGQPYVGCETVHGELGTTFDLSASNAIIKIMVYKTVISDVGIKLANPAGGAQPEIKVANTIVDAWEELTFDFSGRIGNGLDGSTNIDQIVVFPDFNLDGRTSDNVVYFDNISFGASKK